MFNGACSFYKFYIIKNSAYKLLYKVTMLLVLLIGDACGNFVWTYGYRCDGFYKEITVGFYKQLL